MGIRSQAHRPDEMRLSRWGWRCSPARRPDEMRLSRWWLALFPVALAGRDAFESLVALFPVALAGREAFESLALFPGIERTGGV